MVTLLSTPTELFLAVTSYSGSARKNELEEGHEKVQGLLENEMINKFDLERSHCRPY